MLSFDTNPQRWIDRSIDRSSFEPGASGLRPRDVGHSKRPAPHDQHESLARSGRTERTDCWLASVTRNLTKCPPGRGGRPVRADPGRRGQAYEYLVKLCTPPCPLDQGLGGASAGDPTIGWRRLTSGAGDGCGPDLPARSEPGRENDGPATAAIILFEVRTSGAWHDRCAIFP
jgi:hypothetical protein